MTRTVVAARTLSGLLLAIFLLGGLYLTVAMLLLLGAALFLPVILALGGHVSSAVLVVAEFVAVGSVPGLMLIYYCVFTLRRSADEHPAIDVSPGDAPMLWEMVTEVAAAARTRPPTKLRLAAMANATVSEEARLLGLAGGQRYLTIGMPLLLGMTAGELRAVLAHEMGHYARGHTRLGAQVYRGSVALRNTCQALKAAREPDSHRTAIRALWKIRSLYAYLAYGVFAAYSAFYDRVSFAARRRQEFQADACAAENFGRDVTASALRAAHALPMAWNRFQRQYLEPMRKAGYRPDEPFAVFQAMLCDPDYRDVLAELRQVLREEPVSRLDSHPTLTQRLAALPACAATPAVRSGPAIVAVLDLLTDDQCRSVFRDLRREMFRASGTSRFNAEADLPWREWVSTAAALQAAAPAAELVRAAGRLADRPAATLDVVLDLLAAGQGGDLAAALAQGRGESPDAEPAALISALFALTGHYLVEAGRAWWALSWTGPSKLIAADIEADELSDLVAAAVRRPVTEVARMRLHLASLRLDPGAAAPITSLLQPRAAGLADGGPGPYGRRDSVRIFAGADLLTRQRVSAIRGWNLAVGVITAVVALVGIHARDASHSPPPFIPPAFSSPVVAGGPTRGPIPGMGVGISVSPFPHPFPTLSLPKLRLVTSMIVQPGDSLSGIACRYQTTVRALQQMNHLGTSTVIVAGQRLLVPFTLVTTGIC